VGQPLSGIGQQQVAHQLIDQSSAFVQQLTASVMQQTLNQWPSVSQHQPPLSGNGQRQIAHLLPNHSDAFVQQGAPVNVMMQAPNKLPSVSQYQPHSSGIGQQKVPSSILRLLMSRSALSSRQRISCPLSPRIKHLSLGSLSSS